MQSIGQCRAHARVVLMIAGAFDLYGFFIQKESSLRIKTNRANTEGGFRLVDNLRLCMKLGNQSVEIWFTQRPELGRIDGNLRFEFEGISCREVFRVALAGGHSFSLCVQDPRNDSAAFFCSAFILNLTADEQQSTSFLQLRFDERTPVSHVQGSSLR